MTDTKLTDIEKTLLENYFSLFPSQVIAENYQKITGKSISSGAVRAKISRLLQNLDDSEIKQIFSNRFNSTMEIINNRRKNVKEQN